MSAQAGFVLAGLSLGLESILIKPKRSIGPLQAQVTLEETHTDALEITEQPVEQGANITDHAYKRPAEVTIKCGWSNSPSRSNLLDGLVGAVTSTITGVQALVSGNSESQVNQIYQNLLQLQSDRIPFDVYTGKRVYVNMLVKSLVVTTDKESEQALMVTAVLQQIIIAYTQIRAINTAPKEQQKDAQATQTGIPNGTKQLSPAPNFNAGAAVQAINPGATP
jgi:hypothetical protein